MYLTKSVALGIIVICLQISTNAVFVLTAHIFQKPLIFSCFLFLTYFSFFQQSFREWGESGLFFYLFESPEFFFGNHLLIYQEDLDMLSNVGLVLAVEIHLFFWLFGFVVLFFLLLIGLSVDRFLGIRVISVPDMV